MGAWTRRTGCAALLIAGQAALAGCTGGDDREPLLVAAAGSLLLLLPDLGAAFEESTGFAVDFTTGNSSQLAHQVLHGAPVDVFLSADRGWITVLDSAGRIAPSSIAVYARGQLVLWGRGPDAPPELAALPVANIGRIALANPEHAPYGRAAKQALERSGLWDSLHTRLVFGATVRQAKHYAERGDAHLAFTARSIVTRGNGSFTPVSETLYDPLDQALAIVKGTPRPEAARAFVDYVLGEQGRTILARHGFSFPAEAAVP